MKDSAINMMQKLEDYNHIDASYIGHEGDSKHVHLSGIELKGHRGMKEVEEKKRKYRVDISKEALYNINEYREKYEGYLKIHNNTANKEVWKVYDHLMDDLYHEIMG